MTKKNLLIIKSLMFLALAAGLAGCGSSADDQSPSATPDTSARTATLAVQPSETPTPQNSALSITTLTADPSQVLVTEVPTQVTATVAGEKMDRYQYVGQNWPDNLKVLPGAVITITWAIKNIGLVGWTTDYTIRYFSGITAKANYYPFPITVGVGKVVNLSVTIQAPQSPGKYNTWWKLTNGQMQNFGDVDFSFEVSTSK